MEYWELTLSILHPSQGYISQYTPGLDGIFANDIIEGIMIIMIV